MPDVLTPREFADRALEMDGVAVEEFTLGGKTVLWFTRQHGDHVRSSYMIDIPVRIPVSMILGHCRDLGLQASEFSVTLHDL